MKYKNEVGLKKIEFLAFRFQENVARYLIRKNGYFDDARESSEENIFIVFPIHTTSTGFTRSALDAISI